MEILVEVYKDYEIYYEKKPIPTTIFDYSFVHKDYDGAPDSGDRRWGFGDSVESCKEWIDDMIEEEGEEDEY